MKKISNISEATKISSGLSSVLKMSEMVNNIGTVSSIAERLKAPSVLGNLDATSMHVSINDMLGDGTMGK